MKKIIAVALLSIASLGAHAATWGIVSTDPDTGAQTQVNMSNAQRQVDGTWSLYERQIFKNGNQVAGHRLISCTSHDTVVDEFAAYDANGNMIMHHALSQDQVSAQMKPVSYSRATEAEAKHFCR